MTDHGSLRLPTTSTPSLPTELANAVTLWSAALGRGAPAPMATCAPAFETAAAQTDQDESKATRRTRGNSTVTELTGQVLPKIAVAPDGVFGADFRVLGTLGQGGMAQIDVAIQSVFERQVALKHLRADRKSPATIGVLIGNLVGGAPSFTAGGHLVDGTPAVDFVDTVDANQDGFLDLHHPRQPDGEGDGDGSVFRPGCAV